MLRADTKRMTKELDEAFGLGTKAFQKYRKTFEKGVGKDCASKTLKRAAAIQKAIKNDIVLCADIHSAVGPQNVCFELLEAMLRDSRTPPYLVIEFLDVADQKHLDAYLRDQINIDELRDRTNYDNDWGFPYAGYARILELAKANKVPVFASNSSGLLPDRDSIASKVVAEAATRYPDSKGLVEYGQYHHAKVHLPEQIKHQLSNNETQRSMTRVLTGDHSTYFRFIAAGKRPQATQIDDWTYCIYANPPRASRKSMIRYYKSLQP